MTAADVLDAVRCRFQGNGAMVTELTAPPAELVEWLAAGRPGGWRAGAKIDRTERRIDALVVSGGKLIAVEVKVSRADFRRETEAKRAPWRRITHQYVYACPVGLIRPDEVPDGCGLWYAHPGGHIIIAKKAPINKHPEPLPFAVVQRMMYRIGKL